MFGNGVTHNAMTYPLAQRTPMFSITPSPKLRKLEETVQELSEENKRLKERNRILQEDVRILETRLERASNVRSYHTID